MVDVDQVIITQEQLAYFVVMPLTNVLIALMERYVIVVWMGILWIQIQTNVKCVRCSDVWYVNQLLLVANATVDIIWIQQHPHAKDAHQQRHYRAVQYAALQLSA